MATCLSRPTGLLALTTAATLLAGCSEETQTGILTVEYKFGLTSFTCEQQGVVTVEVSLDNGTYDESAPCDTSEGITLEGVPAGSYMLDVRGFDAAGDTIRDNEGDLDSQVAEVIGGQSRVVQVTLSPTPATIELLFDIRDADGFPSLPAGSVAQFFDVTAYRGNGAVLHNHEFSYAQYGGGFTAMPDPDRKVDGDLLEAVEVEVLDASRNVVATVPYQFDMPVGAGKVVQLVVECLVDDCSGTVHGIGGGGNDTGDGTGGTGGTGG